MGDFITGGPEDMEWLKGVRRTGTLIFETAIFDGRSKEWRILNLNTASIYTMSYDTEEEALAAIEDGELRGAYTVRRIRWCDVRARM
jgi:hypothetical protein